MFTGNFLLLEFRVNSHVESLTASCFLYLIQIKSLKYSEIKEAIRVAKGYALGLTLLIQFPNKRKGTEP